MKLKDFSEVQQLRGKLEQCKKAIQLAQEDEEININIKTAIYIDFNLKGKVKDAVLGIIIDYHNDLIRLLEGLGVELSDKEKAVPDFKPRKKQIDDLINESKALREKVGKK